MAIEFNCPYCTARIRVPDHAGGGKGRCPKCSTRITVPRVSAPPPDPTPSEEETSASDELPAFTPHAAPEPLFSPSLPSEPLFAPPVAESLTGFDATVLSEAEQAAAVEPVNPLTGLPQFPIAPPPRPVRSRPLARKGKRKQNLGAWFLLGGVLLVLGGAIGFFFWQQSRGEQFGGELIAETAESLELAPGVVEKSSIKQPADDVAAVLTALEKSPVPLKSSLIEVQLSGSAKGLQVSLSAGPQSRFYRVDVSEDAPLKKYRSQHAAALEEKRLDDIEQAAAAFVLEYRNVIAKKAEQSSITGFRNTLALPALVRGLGHQIVATHGSTIYPCVYEDHEGALYFLLPPGAREFELVGRKHTDGSVVFPGKYKVTVAGEMKLPVKASEEEAAGKSKDKKTPAVGEGDEPEAMKDSKADDAKKEQ